MLMRSMDLFAMTNPCQKFFKKYRFSVDSIA